MKKFKLLLGLSLAASVIAPLAAVSCVNEDTNPPVNEENPDSTTNDNNLSNPSASGDSTTGESSGSTDTNPNPGTESSGTENPGSSSTGESTGSTTGGETSTPSTDTNPNPGSGSSSTENPGTSGESATTSPTEETTQSGAENTTTEGSSSSTDTPTQTPPTVESSKELTIQEKYNKAKGYLDGKFLTNIENASSTLDEVKKALENNPNTFDESISEKLNNLIGEAEKNQTNYTNALLDKSNYSASVSSEKGLENLKKLKAINSEYKNKKVATYDEYITKFGEISNLIREIQKAEKENNSSGSSTNALAEENKNRLKAKLEELKTANQTKNDKSATNLINILTKALEAKTSEGMESDPQKRPPIDFTSTNQVDKFIAAVEKILTKIKNQDSPSTEANSSSSSSEVTR
ncbi:hypothetical protein MM26B8_00460 [Mycoplasmopsis meleagridis]|uniref:hypothetical protein n=1 Tax=Mycoplasmopsis meleagridis TaxID=29561 RepID=UPI0007C31F71|nr:hypothetical protein [Mycoplasmopsis meleagridis]OAD18430.1 hypothetical protein MM26B8_00460 [Mycoplasmopsis meleagridis]